MALSVIGTKFAKLTKATVAQIRASVLFQGFMPSAPRASEDIYADPADVMEAARGNPTGICGAIATKTGAYTLTYLDYVIMADASGGAFTLTLPAAASNPGRHYFIRVIDATGDVTVDGNASETIGGSATQVLTTTADYLHIVSDGTNWQIVAGVVTA